MKCLQMISVSESMHSRNELQEGMVHNIKKLTQLNYVKKFWNLDGRLVE